MDLENIFYAGFFVCPYALNLLGYKRLEMYTQELQTYNGMSTLLCAIPIDQSACGLITYYYFTDTKQRREFYKF